MEFLITEERNELGKRVGDVLNGVSDLTTDMENMGSRHVSRMAEELVNRMRKILHGDWSPKQKPFLRQLQKIAVAIQKTIDEKGDIKQLLQAAAQEMESLGGKLGAPINKLKAPEEDPGQTPQLQPTPPDPGLQQGPPSGTQPLGPDAQGTPPGGDPTAPMMM